jgi:hypothetical protein
MTNLLPWSFSKLKAFEICPRQGYAKYISRELPYVETEAQHKGNEFHKAMEDRIKEGMPILGEYAWAEDYVPRQVKPDDILLAEVPLDLNVNGEPLPKGHAKHERWFTCKIDVLQIEDDDVCWLIDWKTGKPWEDSDQLNLYSVVVKAHYPHVRHWRGFYVWLREQRVGMVHTLSPGRAAHKLRERIERVDVSDTPKKNPLCPWCAVARCENYTGGIGK